MIVTRIDLIPAEAISADIYFRLINRSPRAKTNSCYFYSTTILPPPMPYIYRAATHLVGIVGLNNKNQKYGLSISFGLSLFFQAKSSSQDAKQARKEAINIHIQRRPHPREPSVKNIAQLINMSRSSSKYHARDEQID